MKTIWHMVSGSGVPQVLLWVLAVAIGVVDTRQMHRMCRNADVIEMVSHA